MLAHAGPRRESISASDIGKGMFWRVRPSADYAGLGSGGCILKIAKTVGISMPQGGVADLPSPRLRAAAAGRHSPLHRQDRLRRTPPLSEDATLYYKSVT